MEQDSNLLARLPGELRNRIYDLLFNFSDGLIVAIEDAADSRSCTCNLEASSAVAGIGLLRTCRSAYFEAAGVLYRSNTFKFRINVCKNEAGSRSHDFEASPA